MARRPFLLIAALLAAVVASQILLTPRNAGPDEPAHIVRGAGIVRGDVFGTAPTGEVSAGVAATGRGEVSTAVRAFDVPRWVTEPSEVCFAANPWASAACAIDAPPAIAPSAPVISTASYYPVWGHLLPGLATLMIDGPSALWLARAAHAALPVVLIAATLALLIERQRPLLALSSVLVSLTPMTMFLLAVVNPSGLAIAGALALTVALDDALRHECRPGWLLYAGFAALVLPRDDGPLWAVLCTGLVLLANRAAPWSLRRLLPGAGWAVVTTVWLVGAGWSLFVGSELVSVEKPAAGWEFIESVIVGVGDHINEAIGVFGWLDTPMPTWGSALWIMAFGMIAMAAATVDDRARLRVLGIAVALFVLVAWTLEAIEGRRAGLFWQGRYGLPVVVSGLALAGNSECRGRVVGRMAAVLPGAVAVIVWNAAVFRQSQRWAVGIGGSIRPWTWDVYGTPLPVVVLLMVHMFASTALLVVLVRASPARASTNE